MDSTIYLIYAIFVFIIGTLFGSFFTLATYRIPRKQDIVKTRSYCPNCKHRLGFFDCFPILSYISTVGRCKYCKKPISIRYPLIEFASGMVFLLIFLIFGITWQSLVLIACYVYLFLVIGVDIMKNKMTEEEKAEVERIKESKKKANKKAGAINIDIVVAIVIFIVFFISTIFTSRNYSTALVEYTRKSNALNLCMNNLNNEKAKDFIELGNSSDKVTIDGVEYNYEVNITPYIKGDETLTNAKVIESKVSYTLNGKPENIGLKSIKVDNI